MISTPAKLTKAAADVLREDGLTSVSARSIAARAGVNQALVFYHFGTVAELVQVACREAVDASLAYYREQFGSVTSMVELLRVGRRLHDRERELGNVALMAQLMSGAQQDDTLAAAARYAMAQWNAEIESVVRRVLAGGPVAEIADATGLAHAVSAAFIGLELYDGIDESGARRALDALEQLGVLIEVMDDLGPVARRALRARVRRAGGTRRPPRSGL